jgi:hypothetical protein
MADEHHRPGRCAQHNEARSCGTDTHRPQSTCPQCIPRTVRPFRAVKRYRGDQVVRAFVAAEWCDVWHVQAGDVSWPHGRRG